MRTFAKSLVLVCMVLLVGSVRADEYKDAVVKGVKNGKFVFEVDGQEVQISPGSIAWKAFDASGRQLAGFPGNYRIMKLGNVVNVVTSKKRGTESISEIHLVKGELLEEGKPTTSTRRSAARAAGLDQSTYAKATIKSVDGKKVVLVVDGKELSLIASGSMKAFDVGGRKLTGRGENLRLLKEGNEVSMTTFKGGRGVEVISEIHLLRGSLTDKQP